MLKTTLAVLCLTSVPVFAAGKIEVPASAMKLDAAGIAKHYQGLHATFDNRQNKESLTGEIWYDLARGVAWGFYVWDGKDRGVWKGKIWAKGDQFCNKSDGAKKETCSDVYLDGNTYYETNPDKSVQSVDTIIPPVQPSIPASAKKITVAELTKITKGKVGFITVYDAKNPVVVLGKWNWKAKKWTGEFIDNGTERGKATLNFKIKGDQICTEKFPCASFMADGNVLYEPTADGKLHAKSVWE